ncbi:hypothetical protein PUN28_001962 [Cardiocondyla obscurior]|uniref:Uncharacterized protein n=1 Tax=Cardiocondyla obscurior TaxID=286306 RepID=A0AAW2GRW3_9HYME
MSQSKRREDRTGNRRGFTRFSFGEFKKKKKKNGACGQRSESRDALETQEIKTEIVELAKIWMKKIARTRISKRFSPRTSRLPASEWRPRRRRTRQSSASLKQELSETYLLKDA